MLPCVTWRPQGWWLSESSHSRPQAEKAGPVQVTPDSRQTPGAKEFVEIWNATPTHWLGHSIWCTCLLASGQSSACGGAQGGVGVGSAPREALQVPSSGQGRWTLVTSLVEGGRWWSGLWFNLWHALSKVNRVFPSSQKILGMMSLLCLFYGFGSSLLT